VPLLDIGFDPRIFWYHVNIEHWCRQHAGIGAMVARPLGSAIVAILTFRWGPAPGPCVYKYAQYPVIEAGSPSAKEVVSISRQPA